MRFAPCGTRVGLGLILSLLMLAIGCGKKDPPAPVVPDKPVGDPAKVHVPPAAGGTTSLAALIPTDVAAFGCVNVHALWESTEGKRLRKLAEHVDDGKPLKRMEQEMGVPPGEIDHIAFIFTDIDEEPVFVISTTKPYDTAKVRKSVELEKRGKMDPPKIREEEYKGKKLIIQPLLSFSKVGRTIGGDSPKDKDKGFKDSKDRIPAKDKFAPKDASIKDGSAKDRNFKDNGFKDKGGAAPKEEEPKSGRALPLPE